MAIPTPTPNIADPYAASGPDVSPEVLTRYMNGTATDADLVALVHGKVISANEAQSYSAKQGAGKQSPVDSLYPYNRDTGQVSNYPNESPIGTSAVEAGGPPNTYADPSSGLLYNPKGALLPKYLQVGTGGGGGAGDSVGMGNLALSQQKFDYQQAQDLLTNARADHSARLAAAMQVLNALASMSNDAQARDAELHKNQLAALAYAAPPGQNYVGNFAPDSYAVRMGLSDPIAMQHMQYDPTPAPDPQMAARQAALAQLQQLAQSPA